jgi:hypothetical protein
MQRILLARASGIRLSSRLDVGGDACLFVFPSRQNRTSTDARFFCACVQEA